MKYTKATNYALHIMSFLVTRDERENLSLQPLADHMNMSSTYLSKILTQLVKADLIQSAPGVKGGYSLRRAKEEISFFDVIQAIEGSGAMFTCEMNLEGEGDCKIERVMKEAEAQMVMFLKAKKICDAVSTAK